MATIAHRDLAHRWFDEVWNGRQPEVIHELIAPEGVGHLPAGDLVGPEPFLERVYRPFLAAFPDLHIDVEETLGDEDDIAVRWLATGTHTGEPFLGFPASNRSIRLRGITWIRYRDGQMVEGWDCWDSASLIAQLRGDGPPA
jgi:steroid delta-isomerase-like uncharacterized protein